MSICFLVFLYLHVKNTIGINEIKSLGCWIREKNGTPAIASLEKKSEYLMDNFWERRDPVIKCAKAAASFGYNVFAVSNLGSFQGGECFSSCTAAKDFAKYGDKGSSCDLGTGGHRSIDVYSLDVTTYVGCVKNSLNGYAIPDLEATHPALFGQPHQRKHSIEICGSIARSRGYNVFGITKGGRCLGSGDAYQLFLRLSAGGSGKDCINEKGSAHSISVHLTTGIVEFVKESSMRRAKYQNSRSYRNKRRRAKSKK